MHMPGIMQIVWLLTLIKFSQNQTENITDKQLIKRYTVEEELVSKFEYGIHTGSVYEMKDIYTSLYIESLKENNIEEIRTEKYLKMHLKDLLSKEIDSIVFENSVQWNKSVYSSTYSEKVIVAVISKALADASGNMKNISKTANIVRFAVLQTIKSVEKSFISTQKTHDNDIPTELFSLIKWVLGGHTDLHGARNTELITVAKIYVIPSCTMSNQTDK